ncbi:MAG TPA: EamA family transporter RarD [Anaerolineaceae bacterium]
MNKGILYTAAAYLLWGMFPLYFKAIENVPAIQIVSHRIVWSLLFLVLVILALKQFGKFRAQLSPRIVGVYLIAGVLLSINWLTYVWSVNAGFVVEASLGYFINPLVSVLLGVIFLKEKMRPWQWVPFGIAAAGVIYLTLSRSSSLWVPLTLAFSFGLYGLMKKLTPLGSLYGLTVETAMVSLPALGFLVFMQVQGSGAFWHAGVKTTLLLAFTGVVTAVPLLLFSAGTRSIPLTMVGLLQYITPTMQFLLGVFVYGEPFTFERLIGFCIIWIGLMLFTLESVLSRRKVITVAASS